MSIIWLNSRRFTPPAGEEFWTPALLPLALWLDAADLSTISINSGVSVWQDKSGNALNATQSTPERRLTYNATGFNGLPCLQAAGVNVMVLPTLPLTSGGVVFYGFSVNDDGYGVVANNSGHWDRFGGDGRSYPGLLRSQRIDGLTLSAPVTGQHIMCYVANPAAEYTIRLNGAQIYSSGPFTFANNIAGLGAGHNIGIAGGGGGSPALVGSIVEIAVVPGIMSLADIQKVEGYLANKWGLNANLPANHPYRNDRPLLSD
jgi:hypothetical protein